MPSDKQQASPALTLNTLLANPLVVGLLVPALFIFLWGNGYIGAKLVLPSSSPWTVLSLRFAIVAVILLLAALLLGSPWPDTRGQIFHIAIIGILLHALYLGGAFMGMDSGVEAATSALIGAIPPLLTAFVAWALVGERLGWIGWLGLVVGIAGVTLVVYDRMGLGLGTGNGFIANFLGAVALAVSAAYQKRYVNKFNWITGGVVQFTAASLFALVVAFMFEDMKIDITRDFVVGMLLLVFALSLGAVTLLQFLISRGAATGVMSLLFLVPVSTALTAWPIFGETFGIFSLFGFAIAVLGVWLVQKGLTQKRNVRK